MRLSAADRDIVRVEASTAHATLYKLVDGKVRFPSLWAAQRMRPPLVITPVVGSSQHLPEPCLMLALLRVKSM